MTPSTNCAKLLKLYQHISEIGLFHKSAFISLVSASTIQDLSAAIWARSVELLLAFHGAFEKLRFNVRGRNT